MTEKELDEDIYNNNKEKGFWPVDEIIPLMEKFNFSKEHIESVKSAFRAQKLMLIVSELSEAMEADRHDKRFLGNLDVINRRSRIDVFAGEFLYEVKDTFEDELADVSIRLRDLAMHENCNLMGHVQAKHRYNKTRPYKHNKKY